MKKIFNLFFLVMFLIVSYSAFAASNIADRIFWDVSTKRVGVVIKGDGTKFLSSLKEYIATGVSETDPTVSCTATTTTLKVCADSDLYSSWALNRGIFIPYVTADGTWRLKFNISVSFTAGTFTDNRIYISGITSKSTTNFYQTITVLAGNTSGTNNPAVGTISPNTRYFQGNNASLTLNMYAFSGDIELDSKPYWVDAN